MARVPVSPAFLFVDAEVDPSITVDISDQVVFRIRTGAGVQTVNFPVTQLSTVKALLDEVAADEDVLALIVANTSEPDPEEPAE